MYNIIIQHTDADKRVRREEMTALEYQRQLRDPNYDGTFVVEGKEVPAEECEISEKASAMGTYVLHVARKHGWTSVTIAGEAAHLLDVLIDEEYFLHGGVPGFGTLLRQTSDPLTLDREVVRVEDLVKDSVALASTSVSGALSEVLDAMRKKLPLTSPTKEEKYTLLREAVEKSTATDAGTLIRELRRLVKKNWPDVPSPSDSEEEEV